MQVACLEYCQFHGRHLHHLILLILPYKSPFYSSANLYFYKQNTDQENEFLDRYYLNMNRIKHLYKVLRVVVRIL